ncbi:uncharacterized protein AMSG_00879 [Thecamonas trahens ATCC 50062]|uniref:Centrosomal protein of 162 kDa n=1 Tax=Thecamonas trahens ATCC 50062 TaxID=461836 RepID=A0A0L0DIB5_THETB|nr:hypothetical protein AMSG_00879 [Thecamonas trahens ATCC 50062]KNC52052.1 hypothetical protein AMSG_00879 [Thecamonas trahens ATCC 50062]|eukprot:XP_013762058.1 hypothetical protein AMSG_00879 [Thecamonas trahens ATCC 50062]
MDDDTLGAQRLQHPTPAEVPVLPTPAADLPPPTPAHAVRWSGDRDGSSVSPEVSLIAAGPFDELVRADAGAPAAHEASASPHGSYSSRSRSRSRSTPLSDKLEELAALRLSDADDSAAKAEFFARKEREGPVNYGELLAEASASDDDSDAGSVSGLTVPLQPTLSATPTRAPAPAAASFREPSAELSNQRATAELRAELTRLYAQLAEAQDATVQAKAALARHKREAERAARIAHDKADATIKGLRAEVDELRTKLAAPDVKEQEALIQGFQRENEKLCAEIKELKTATASPAAASPDAAPARRTPAPASPSVLSSPAPSQDPNPELVAELEAARTRELELKFELDKSRKEKKELAARVAGINLDTYEATLAELEALKAKAAQEADDAASRVASLTSKLRWYEENQELIDASDAELADARATIEALRLRLADAGISSPDTHDDAARKRAAATRAADKRRIRELEAQVANMDEVIRNRFPDSIPELIRAAAPSSDDNETIAFLKGELERVNAAFDAAQDKHSRELRVLRQKHEKTRAFYERELEAAADGAPRPRRNPPPTRGRVAELERTLANVRSLYQRKLRDADAKIARLEAQASAPPQAASRPASGPPGRVRALRTKIRTLERELAEARAANAQLRELGDSAPDPIALDELRARNRELAEDLDAARADVDDARAAANAAEHAHAAELNAITTAHDAAMDALLSKLDTAEWSRRAKNQPPASPPPPPTALENKENDPVPPTPKAQRQLKSQVDLVLTRLEALEAAHLEPSPAVPAPPPPAPVAADEVTAALDMYRSKVSNMQSKLVLAHARIAELEEANAELRIEASKLRSSPALTNIAKLARKIEDMEKRHMLRELELESIIEDTKTSSKLDLALVKKEHANQLAAKNSEIAIFQNELDSLLGTVDVLRAALV